MIENYCPTVAPDPNSHIQCERDLAGNYVTLLEMVVEHFFVEGAEHICKAWGVCPVVETPSMNEYINQSKSSPYFGIFLYKVHLSRVHRWSRMG